LPSIVTLAFRAVPTATLLRPLRLTVRLVAVAAVTVPVTPSLKLTLSLAIVVSKPAVLDVTVGTRDAERLTLATPNPGLLPVAEAPLSQNMTSV